MNPVGEYGDSTRCVSSVAGSHLPGQPMQLGPAFAAPYQLSEDEGSESDTYARVSNPGWRGLEAALGMLEGAQHTIVTGSGMSAITMTLRSLLVSGDTVVVPSDGYYQVRRYAEEALAPLGIGVREVSTSAMGEKGFGELLATLTGRVVVVAETPSNPTLDVVDLRALAAVCHRAGGVLMVDNTTATPLGQRPLELGADIVVASGTKALSGHSDLLMGYVATSDPGIAARIERERTLSGTVLGPFETWLAHRSLGTAGLRFARHCDNAQVLAQMLSEHPAVRSVRYPGLPDDPSFTVASAQMRRFGGLVSIELESAAAFHSFVAASQFVTAATSFGGIHTTADRRARWGDPVSEGFVRISCGIEDTADIVADVAQALTGRTFGR